MRETVRMVLMSLGFNCLGCGAILHKALIYKVKTGELRLKCSLCGYKQIWEVAGKLVKTQARGFGRDFRKGLKGAKHDKSR